MEQTATQDLITITKEEVNLLPKVLFTGRIITIETIEDAEKAVAYLSTFDTLGMDTETKPAFRKGQHHQVSLLQISTIDTCFLFRLNHIGLPQSLSNLLSSNNTNKIGLSLRDDFGMLRKIDTDFNPQNFIDLQNFVKPFKIGEMSLQKIFAILFKEKISKNQRLTNWEADVLTEKQKEYAAIDAWACLKIYHYLTSNHNQEQ